MRSHSQTPRILLGAHTVSPRVFASKPHAAAFFGRYHDHANFASQMFSVTTVVHKTSDTAQPLVMLTNREGARYFFGKVPEGTQRALNENRFRLGKLKSIFLTGVALSWLDLGGLPGLFLTISDSTKRSIDVFCGSPLLRYVVATWRYFVFRKGVELKINDVEGGTLVADSNVHVTALRVYPGEAEASAEAPRPAHGAACSSPRCQSPHLDSAAPCGAPASSLDHLVSQMFPLDTLAVNSRDPNSYKVDPSETDAHTHVALPHPSTICATAAQPSTSYLVEFVPIRGKFDAERAKALGVRPGPDFRRLADGELVVTASGRVDALQVVGEPKTFASLLILDIPDRRYLANTAAQLARVDEVRLAYHFLGDSVDAASAQFGALIARFHPDCRHVVSHLRVLCNLLVFKTAALNVLKLKAVQPECFNLPRSGAARDAAPPGAVALHSQQVFQILADGVTEQPPPSQPSWLALYDEHVAPLGLGDKQRTIDCTPIALDIGGSFDPGALKDLVQIVTLGTGSALPSMHRNVISTLLRVPYTSGAASGAAGIEYRSVLLDGGENTIGTMMRNFGPDLDRVMSELRLIYLSHLHADHHLGIVSIVRRWFECNRDPSTKLHLVLPWQYHNFLREWFALEDDAVDLGRINYVSCEEFLTLEAKTPQLAQRPLDAAPRARAAREPLAPPPLEQIAELLADLGLASVATCRAIHCYWAYLVTLDFKLDATQRFKVSYLGDTRPNPRFAEIGAGSDLLIHESSLAEDLIEEALAKKHSTMIEAVTMAKLMRCPKVVLTHFSTRYSNRADLLVDPCHLASVAARLGQYLSSHGVARRSNVLLDGLAYNDLDICYAFDMMTIAYGELQLERFNYTELLRMFASEELQSAGDADSLQQRKEREVARQHQKRDAKRDERLKKRRTEG